MHSLNFSIYSDETQNTLWRIQNGALDSVKPKVSVTRFSPSNIINRMMAKWLMYVNVIYRYLQIVVLLVGTNNTQHTAEEVAEGILEIVKNIRDKLPDAYIVLPVILNDIFFFVQLRETDCNQEMFWSVLQCRFFSLQKCSEQINSYIIICTTY